MITIKHKDTGAELTSLNTDSLAGADLREVYLQGADLSGMADQP